MELGGYAGIRWVGWGLAGLQFSTWGWGNRRKLSDESAMSEERPADDQGAVGEVKTFR